MLDNQPHIFIDLAMPRDIDSRVTQLPNVSLFDMDDLSLPPSVVTIEQIQYAKEILLEHQTEFEHWYAFREWVPTIQSISKNSCAGCTHSHSKIFERLPFKEGTIHLPCRIPLILPQTKRFAKLLYGLREHLTQDYFSSLYGSISKIS